MNLRNVAEYSQSIRHRGIEQIGNREAFVLNRERLAVVTLSTADFARNIHIRQETHFDLTESISLAGFTAAPFHVETEAARFVPAGARLWQHGVEFANRREHSGVRCGVR